MKYCLTNNVSSTYLTMADEIKVKYKDRKTIIDLVHNYPNKLIILGPTMEDYNWEEIIRYNNYSKNNLVLICANIPVAAAAKEAGIKFILNAEVTNYWDLRGLIEFGAYGAYVGIPLFFQLESTKDLDIRLRAVPTQAYNHTLPRKNGIHGQWMRPEDVTLYEDYIDVLEFENCDVEREETLFRIYKIQKKWNSQLEAIIKDLGVECANRMIPPKVAETRLHCGQKCEAGKSCRICDRELNLAKLVLESEGNI